jgi:transcriptional regulator with XRE-family HTH domain
MGEQYVPERECCQPGTHDDGNSVVTAFAFGNTSRVGNLTQPKPKRVSDAGREMGKRIFFARGEMMLKDDRYESLRWFSEQVGTSSSTISRYENGEREPDSIDNAILEKIAGLLEVTPGWIRYGTEPKRPGGKPPVVFDLSYYLSHHLKDHRLVNEVLQNPARWPLDVVHRADEMRNAEGHAGLTPKQRLETAETTMRVTEESDDRPVEQAILKEHDALRPRRGRKAPKK